METFNKGNKIRKLHLTNNYYIILEGNLGRQIKYFSVPSYVMLYFVLNRFR